MTGKPGDAPSDAHAPADAGAQADDAYKSAVDLSDLQAELDKTASKDEGDEDDQKHSTGDDAGDSSSEEETDEKADDESDDEDSDDESDDGEKPPKRNRSQRYRDQIARLQEENLRLSGRTGGDLSADQLEARVKAVIGDPPKESDFANYLDFDRAATAYELDKRQATREVKAKAADEAVARGARDVERVERHRERINDFKNRGTTKEEKAANAADYDKVMADAKGSKVAPHVEDLILDSDRGGHLAYYFAKNPERLASINRMTERDAAREIGRIESRLAVPKPKTQSSAPKPPARPKGGAAPTSQEAELDAYITRRYGKK